MKFLLIIFSVLILSCVDSFQIKPFSYQFTQNTKVLATSTPSDINEKYTAVPGLEQVIRPSITDKARTITHVCTSGTLCTTSVMDDVKGQESQSGSCVAISFSAGRNYQKINAIAIGENAGYHTQGSSSVAIGAFTAENNQGSNAVAIGFKCGKYSQGNYAVSMGYQSGFTNQGNSGIAVGFLAGNDLQGVGSVRC